MFSSVIAAMLGKSGFTTPPGSWDSHMHVTDIDQFPPTYPAHQYSNTSPTYAATNYTLAQALQNATRLGLPRLVFIQPSTYLNDNSCVLWCLQQFPPGQARGVVVIDPHSISETILLEWHKLGVRGARINLKSFNTSPSYHELEYRILSIDRALQCVPSWGIHFYTDLVNIPAIASVTQTLSPTRKICIDHMACPTQQLVLASDARDVTAWIALKQMLARPNVFVKISAPYRILEPSRWHELEGLAKELLQCRNGDAVVFASDWPHTRFEGMDVLPWRELCLGWCGGDRGLRQKLFVTNAEQLYDVTN